MPYIKQKEREKLDQLLEPLCQNLVGCSWGQINYIITKIILAIPAKKNKKNYTHHQLIDGLLWRIIQEYDRRMVIPYEDKKIEENGDVFK